MLAAVEAVAAKRAVQVELELLGKVMMAVTRLRTMVLVEAVEPVPLDKLVRVIMVVMVELVYLRTFLAVPLREAEAEAEAESSRAMAALAVVVMGIILILMHHQLLELPIQVVVAVELFIMMMLVRLADQVSSLSVLQRLILRCLTRRGLQRQPLAAILS